MNNIINEKITSDKNLSGKEFVDYISKHDLNNRIEFNVDDFLHKERVFEEIFEECPVLVNEKNIIFIWDTDLNKYVEISKNELANYISNNVSFYKSKETDNKFVKNYISIFKRNNYYEILNSIYNYAMDFYREKITKLSKDEIAFKNKIINIKTLETKDNNKNYFAEICFDYNLDLNNINTPIIDKTFKQWVDKENVPLLYEIIGYCMLRDYPIHKLFCLHSAGRSGKGKYFEILCKVINKQNVVSTDLLSLERYTHETAKLYKKLVASISETNLINNLQTSKLKAIVGQSELSANQKNKDPFYFVSYAKVIIETQFIPDSEDISDGYVSRWILIPFPNTFDGTVNPLDKIPAQEYEALANKCLIALHNVLKKGHFHNDLKSIAQKRHDLLKEANPINHFMETYTEESDGGHIKVADLVKKMQIYLKKKKFEITNALLYRKIRRFGLYVDRINIKNNDTEQWKTYRVYADIKFKSNITEIEDNVVINDVENQNVFKTIKFNDKIDLNKEYNLNDLNLLIQHENEEELLKIITQMKKQGNLFCPKKDVYKFENI